MTQTSAGVHRAPIDGSRIPGPAARREDLLAWPDRRRGRMLGPVKAASGLNDYAGGSARTGVEAPLFFLDWLIRYPSDPRLHRLQKLMGRRSTRSR
jgi:hypothetical protein